MRLARLRRERYWRGERRAPRWVEQKGNGHKRTVFSARSNPFVPVLFSVCARFPMQLQWPLQLWQ